MKSIFLWFVFVFFVSNLEASIYEDNWHHVPFVAYDDLKQTNLEFHPRAISFRIKSDAWLYLLNKTK